MKNSDLLDETINNLNRLKCAIKTHLELSISANITQVQRDTFGAIHDALAKEVSSLLDIVEANETKYDY